MITLFCWVGVFPVEHPFLRYRQWFGLMHDLTGFQRDILYAIAGKTEPHGLAIQAELEEYYR